MTPSFYLVGEESPSLSFGWLINRNKVPELVEGPKGRYPLA